MASTLYNLYGSPCGLNIQYNSVEFPGGDILTTGQIYYLEFNNGGQFLTGCFLNQGPSAANVEYTATTVGSQFADCPTCEASLITPTPTTTSTPTPTPTGTVSVTPSPTGTSSVTPTPTPTGTASVTPTPTATAAVTPTPTQTQTGTASVTPTPTPTQTGTASVTPTPTPTQYPFSGIGVNSQYEYTVGILGNFSGGSINEGGPANGIAPHPIYTDAYGVPYAQLNAITLGGVNGLNN